MMVDIREFTPPIHQLSVNSKSRLLDIQFPPFINQMSIRLPSSISGSLPIIIGSFVKNRRIPSFIGLTGWTSLVPNQWGAFEPCSTSAEDEL
jgi:hypothetical protein